jgi:hypothetical protein
MQRAGNARFVWIPPGRPQARRLFREGDRMHRIALGRCTILGILVALLLTYNPVASWGQNIRAGWPNTYYHNQQPQPGYK